MLWVVILVPGCVEEQSLTTSIFLGYPVLVSCKRGRQYGTCTTCEFSNSASNDTFKCHLKHSRFHMGRCYFTGTSLEKGPLTSYANTVFRTWSPALLGITPQWWFICINLYFREFGWGGFLAKLTLNNIMAPYDLCNLTKQSGRHCLLCDRYWLFKSCI